MKTEVTMNNEVTCKACGTVHFPVTRKEAIEEIDAFNTYYDSLPKKKQQDYYGGRKSSIKQYDRCSCCRGSYKNFRVSKEDDCPDGCTIGPILHFDDP